jgi:hypothetical protein
VVTRLELAAARIGDLAFTRLASLPGTGSPGAPVGRAKPRASGRVESVYRSAVNVVCEAFGETWSVCLLPAGAPLHPYAVTVAGAGPGDVAAFLDAYRGERVPLSKNAIELGDGRLSISLDRAEVWDSRLEPLAPLRGGQAGRIRDAVWRGVMGAMGEGADVAQRGAAVGDSMMAGQATSHFLIATMESGGIPLDRDRGCGCVLDGLMAEATRGRLAALQEALGARPAAGQLLSGVLAEHIKCLVGFGEGLTPSGDDFLLGLLAASRFAPAAGRAPLETAVAEMLPTLAAATTRESSRMLEAAVAGHYPEPILGLLVAAAGNDPNGIRCWVGCLRELGATSGQDMLAGVLVWLGGKWHED